MKLLNDVQPSELGIFVFLGWFAGLAMGVMLGIGIGWAIL